MQSENCLVASGNTSKTVIFTSTNESDILTKDLDNHGVLSVFDRLLYYNIYYGFNTVFSSSSGNI
jgi:hypothetical protein